MRTASRPIAVIITLVALAAPGADLTVAFKTRILSEGMGTLTNWGSVTLPTVLSNDVDVTLSPDDTTEILVTNSVSIPAGELSAAFDLTVLTDPVADGLRTVEISASASVPGPRPGTFYLFNGTGTVEVADTGGTVPRLHFGFASRVDRYVIDFFDDDVQAAVEENFSGCALTPDDSTLAIVCKQRFAKEYVQLFDTNAVYGKSIKLVYPDFDDVEGICLVNAASNLYALSQETHDDITILAITTNTTQLSKAGAEVLEVDLPFGKEFNLGIEGVTYDPLNDVFYIVQEKLPESAGAGPAIFRVRRSGSNTVTEALFDAPEVFDGLASDFSDVTYDPYSGRLFILSHEDHAVFECDMAGRIMAILPLPAEQPEGIVMSSDGGTMYIASEDNEIYRYTLAAAGAGPEGINVQLPVVLSRPSSSMVSADYVIWSDTAEEGIDYTPASGAVTFAAGVTTGLVSFSILSDAITEPDEILNIRLTNAVNADLACDSLYRYTIEGDAVRLVVNTPYGNASPAAGTNIITYLTELRCSIIDSPVLLGGGTQVFCAGWSGSNSVPLAGAGTSTAAFVLTNDSWISWHWGTNVWLGTSADGGGAIVGGNRWLPPGTNITIEARTNRYYEFAGWSGDVGAADTNAATIGLFMDRSRLVVAHFPALLAPLGTPQWWLALHYGHTNDFTEIEIGNTDQDAFTAWEEYIADTDPTNGLSYLRFGGVGNEAGDFLMAWFGSEGRLYDIYSSTNLLQAGWLPLGSNIAGEALSPTVFTDTRGTNRNVFYRLKVRLP